MSHKVLILLLLLQSCAYRKFSRTPSSSVQETAVPESLIRDLKKITRMITHKTYVYHWNNLHIVDPKKQQNPMDLALTRGRSVARGFWSDDLPDYGLVGNGLYMARDPLLSSRYGPDLISVTLSPGTRLLDIRRLPTALRNDDYGRGNTIEVSDQTISDLQKAGCSLPRIFALRDHVFRSKECTAIFKEAFIQLKIAGNIHHWWGHNLAVCSGEATAFVLWDETLFTENNIRLYGAKLKMDSLKPEATLEFAYLYALAEASIKQHLKEGDSFAILSKTKKSEVESYHPEVFDPANLRNWMTSHSFNCHGVYPEDMVGGVQDLEQVGSEEPITVVSATYGGNLDVSAADNVLPLLKTSCDGKTFCAFPNYPLGIPQAGVPIGDLLVEWSCGQSMDKYRTYLKTTPASTRKMHSIYCPSNRKTVTLPFDRIKILKAAYGDREVTDKTSAFCDGGGECNYKVSWKHLGLSRDKNARAFEVEWSCTNTPEQIRTRKIPEPAEGVIFKINCDEDKK